MPAEITIESAYRILDGDVVALSINKNASIVQFVDGIYHEVIKLEGE